MPLKYCNGGKRCSCRTTKRVIPSITQLFIEDLEDQANLFTDGTEGEKQRIVEDVKRLIPQRTNFPTYADTPVSLRKQILHQSIGFIRFGV